MATATIWRKPRRTAVWRWLLCFHDSTDVKARVIAEKFGERVIVKNRVGANGLVGTLAVANAAPTATR